MHQQSKRSSLFLLELILAIGFFCVASAVCVQIFIKSYTIERESTALNHAVHLATSVAETFRCTDLESYETYYDKEWNTCDETDAFYTLEVSVERDNSLQIVFISVKADNSTIYELEVLKNENKEDIL